MGNMSPPKSSEKEFLVLNAINVGSEKCRAFSEKYGNGR